MRVPRSHRQVLEPHLVAGWPDALLAGERWRVVRVEYQLRATLQREYSRADPARCRRAGLWPRGRQPWGATGLRQPRQPGRLPGAAAALLLAGRLQGAAELAPFGRTQGTEEAEDRRGAQDAA